MRFHIQQESEIPASSQLYNQICFAIAARHYPPGHRLPSTRQLAMQTGLHRNTISKVYRQLETDGVVEAIAGSGIYVRDQQKQKDLRNSSPSIRKKVVKDIDNEVRKSIDELLNAGCTLQQTRELFTREIDWRLRCGARLLVSTPREDIGASLLIAEELAPHLDVPVEVVPMEELESVLESSSKGTVVTSRYFLQPLEEIAKRHKVRAVAVDLSDFQKELTILKKLRSGSCVGIVSISPGLLRAAEVILHSIRGNDILLMTANPENNSTIVTSRYFLQPLEKVAKQHGVRAIAVDLSDFQKELKILKELNPGSCVGIVSISPGLLRAAEVIIHSMRGSELMLMTAISDNNSRLLSLLKASNHIVCDGPSLSVVENTLLKNRSQLMRLPQIICAKNYLSIETINQLKKEIGIN